MFNVHVTREDELREEIKTLHPKRVISAQVRAINKTARGLRTQISKGVRKEVALKSSTIKDSMSMTKAKRSARPRAMLDVDAKPIPLKHYGARQIRKGTSVRVKKTSGRKLVKHAFVVKGLGNHVFKRKGDDRLPIKKLFGPSVRQEVEQLRPELNEYADETLEKRLREEINWEVEKERRR